LPALFVAFARKLFILPTGKTDQSSLLPRVWRTSSREVDNEMKKRYLLLLILAISGFGVFLYNYWSYSCGRCNNESLLTITLPAEILIGVNLMSLVVLTRFMSGAGVFLLD
jgi:hypothetical protein